MKSIYCSFSNSVFTIEKEHAHIIDQGISLSSSLEFTASTAKMFLPVGGAVNSELELRLFSWPMM